ncbi:hypothetical protein [Nocardia cerradoensis]|nr:hypothetical protein [Nocardia cerradoensis]
MDGGTTFHFVDNTSENVLDQAFSAAGGKDIRLGGYSFHESERLTGQRGT